MEAQTDIQTYLEQGKQSLAQGQAREAAIAYAHAAQIEPNNPMVHLGLGEANLALGSYGVVYMACRKVQELQPQGGLESRMAQALLNLLDRRYDRALQDVDAVISEDPSIAYAHALRSYLLRINKQDYDAGLARARASRLSYGGKFENSFPPVEQAAPMAYTGANNGTTDTANDATFVSPGAPPRAEREPVPPWSQPNTMQRQVTRTRFMLSQNPRLFTYILIAINVAVYLVLAFQLGSLDLSNLQFLVDHGAQYNAYVAQGQYWRIFTAMFIHFSIIHIALNMLSLFFVGSVVELFYGKWRYLLIYMLSGIGGGLVTYFFSSPDTVAAGASGAIFGVFGALGVFYIINRRALGAYGNSAIMNWLFWIGLNIVWSFQPGIGLVDHIGGLIIGMILALIFTPRLRPRIRRLN